MFHLSHLSSWIEGGRAAVEARGTAPVQSTYCFPCAPGHILSSIAVSCDFKLFFFPRGMLAHDVLKRCGAPSVKREAEVSQPWRL